MKVGEGVILNSSMFFWQDVMVTWGKVGKQVKSNPNKCTQSPRTHSENGLWYEHQDPWCRQLLGHPKPWLSFIRWGCTAFMLLALRVAVLLRGQFFRLLTQLL